MSAAISFILLSIFTYHTPHSLEWNRDYEEKSTIVFQICFLSIQEGYNVRWGIKWGLKRLKNLFLSFIWPNNNLCENYALLKNLSCGKFWKKLKNPILNNSLSVYQKYQIWSQNNFTRSELLFALSKVKIEQKLIILEQI